MASACSSLLYVEDEDNDMLLMRMAFAKEGLEPLFRGVNTGQAAIDYLSGTGPYAQRAQYPVPAALLLDLNLPEVHGFDVLKWIRANPAYATLPVIVFSSSVRQEDRERARLLGANEFIPKPNSPALFRDIVRTLKDRWLTTNGAEAR